MALYNIYAGLGGGFGGAYYDHTEEFETREEAEKAAYELAREIYESYEGCHGLRSYSEVIEDNGTPEDEMTQEDKDDCWEEYIEEVEGWLDYKAILTSEDEEMEEEDLDVF